MDRIHFVTFGSLPQFRASLERIQRQATESGYFKSITIYTQDNLPGIQDHLPFITTHKRGYGYWVWKPLAIKAILDKIDTNDFVMYLDAGCFVQNTPEARHTLENYIQRLIEHPSHRLGVSNGCRESTWCKGDLIEAMGLQDSEHLSTSQLQTGTQLMMKTPENISLVEEWIEWATKDNYHYLTDAPSVSQNPPDFSEHRHDQSIYSLLFKRYGYYRVGSPGSTGDAPWLIMRSRNS
jgi:hypothetical protein